MDDPRHVVPGSAGPAIPGTEMKLAENDEIIVRGPHIFAGYWQRPKETEQALTGGWFHTGDQGEVDAAGNWRITGRLKNLLILNSGHNIAPEPLEDALMRELPEAQQIMLLGNQKSFLAALITPGCSNGLTPERVQACIDACNASLPHYKQIRAFRIVDEAFTIENGLLTANGKIKRDAVLARHAAAIEDLYPKKGA
ncbi:MAG: long-chain fatty acid--CoA ligase, partial [Candidatus Acidiferrales bacterium]